MKKSSKNNSKSKSINLGNSDSENELEIEETDGFEAALAGKLTSSVWAAGGQQRDHAIQVLLNLVSNFGVRDTVAVEGSENAFREVFYKGSYAIENVNGLRQFMRDMEDPVTRELMIQISKYKMMPRYIVPLYCMSLDDRTLSMPLLRLFLLLTKPLASNKTRALSLEIRNKRGKETREEASMRVGQEQENKRNAYAQVDALLSFKASLVTDEVFNVILTQAADALLKEPNLRSEDDKKVIECTLMLISNLLAIEPGPQSSVADKALAKDLQNKLVLILAEDFFGLILLLCQTIMDKENRPWNFVLVEIVYFLLRHRDPKELVKLSGTDIESVLARDRSRQQQQQVQGVARRRAPGSAPPPVTGLLHDALSRERAERLAAGGSMAAGARMNRLGGVLVIPPSVKNVEGGSVEEGGSAGVVQLVRDPRMILDEGSFARPHVQRKRSKANFTFTQDTSGGLPVAKSSSARGEEERRVMWTLSSFLDTLLSSGFGELVYSVKEGWRREDPMKGAEEMMYFSMVATCLHYQRLKIQTDHKKRHLATSADDAQQPWMPELKNITQCFDRMSIMRPIDSIVKIREESKLYDQLVGPVELYKEQICFLRVMLESDDLAHNDIALGALHKIFYMSYTERMDPVMALLRDWKPGAYTRQHLNLLIELVHETMKLLDTADYCFKQESSEESIAAAKKRSRKKDEKDDERAQYVASALRFDPNDYFRRLVSNQTTRMYTRALELYSSNPQHINHYIFVFFQRMCSYKIESDETISRPPSVDPERERELPGDLSLGHLLFNIPTLSVFSDILNDRAAVSNKQMEPLLRLIRGVVRKFGEATERNRMMFVEVLFQHAHPVAAWQRIEGVYEATSLAKGFSAGVGGPQMEESDEEEAADGRSDSDDSGDNLDDVMDMLTRTVPKDYKKKKGKTKRAKSKEKRQRGADESSDEDRVVTKKRRRGRQWTSEEDEVLRKLYALYAGSGSVFNVIAQHEDLTSLEGNKSVLHVSRRVRELDLNLMLLSDSDSEEERVKASRASVEQGKAADDGDATDADSSPKQKSPAPFDEVGDDSGPPTSSGKEEKGTAASFWDSDGEDDADDERWRRVVSAGGAQKRKLQKMKTSRSAPGAGGGLVYSSESDLEDDALFAKDSSGLLRGVTNGVLVDSDDE